MATEQLTSNLTTYDARGNAVRVSETSALFVLLSVIATIGVIAYMLFLLDPANRGDLLPYAMVIVAESILVFQALLSMWTILSSGYEPRTFEYFEAKRSLQPEVDPRTGTGDDTLHLGGRPLLIDVFITVYGEDIETVSRTVRAAVAMRGVHRTWVLDDGRSDELKAATERLGAWYVRRLSSNGAKAGNVNHALSIAKGELFAIFDADFVPDPEFLIETVPFFASDRVAFVQTPQAYGNLNTIIARGAAYMQTVFYRFVQRGRNRFNAAFCVGTNVIYRRAAIDEIGGIHADSKSEDVWTALTLHERGWRSIYISDVLAVGDAPETIEGYSKQQLRWATGGFEILLTHNPLSPRRRLSGDQRIQYLVTATFYLTGICPLLLLLVPPMEIYLDLRPMNLTITPVTWALYYFGFYAMQIVLAWFVTQERPDMIESLAPVMNALAADIAGGSGGGESATGGDTLTALRVFDPYRGHSWAAGLAPFADGNNQESSSEAVAAWNALALWAEATGDEALQARAVWLLSAEAESARSLWLEPTDLPAGYAHSMVSLTWSDKRDYATWFSAEPSAILGIQALPLGPVSLQYLAGDTDRVAANVTDAGAAVFDGPLGDYVVGYSALGGADALARATELIDARDEFDDGWSKALAQAWVTAVAADTGR